jgi:hypothetical protein
MLAAVFAVLLGLAIPMSLAHASIVADGSFNAPSGCPGFTNLTPTQMFGAWTVTGSGSGPFGQAGVDLIGGYWAAPTPGGGSVDLDGFAPGGITQSIANLAAGSYLLSFYLSGNPDGWPATKTVEVTIGNVVVPFTYTLTSANSQPCQHELPARDGEIHPQQPRDNTAVVSQPRWRWLALGAGHRRRFHLGGA